MVCYYLEVITLLFFVYVDRVEEGGREGWGNICLEAFILSACISKAISGLSTTLVRVFFFKAQPWRYFITVYWFCRKVMQLS